MIPAQVYCRVVRFASEANKPGTGFLFDHAEGLCLITANHLTLGHPEEFVTFQQAWGGAEPVTEYLDVIGRDSTADVVAFALPEHLWPKWFVGTVPLQTRGVVYGQDCYILGYPYALATRVGARGQQMPIIRKGVVAGSFNQGEQRGWYVDAWANPGFSGGPLVYERQGTTGQYAVAGLIRGQLMAPESEPTAADPKPRMIPAGLAQCTDVKHILDLGLRNGAEAGGG